MLCFLVTDVIMSVRLKSVKASCALPGQWLHFIVACLGNCVENVKQKDRKEFNSLKSIH